MLGFLLVYFWLTRPATRARTHVSPQAVQDFLTLALIGVLVGGRLFFVLADVLSHHNLSWYLMQPINLIAVWNGGMGFFGGFLGVVIAVWLFIRRHPQVTFLALADEVVVLMPICLALTRIVNFINDELPGRLCRPDHPWCMVFPLYPGARYPSQLMEAALDLVILPLLLFVTRRRWPAGARAWLWCAWYGIARFIDEIWRQTDIQVGPFTGAQILALPMLVVGVTMLVLTLRRAPGGLSG